MAERLTMEQQAKIREKAVAMFEKAGIPLSEDERNSKLTLVDFGLGYEDFYKIGIVMMTTVNTQRYCGRYILFFPGQSCAQHWHPDVEGSRGKEETFRVLWGTVYAYGEGEPTPNIQAKVPEGYEAFYGCRHEYILEPGDQLTLNIHEKHWFQAGPEGAISYETSSAARDDYDVNEAGFDTVSH